MQVYRQRYQCTWTWILSCVLLFLPCVIQVSLSLSLSFPMCVSVYVLVHLFIGSFSRSISMVVFDTHTFAIHTHRASDIESHWRAYKYFRTQTQTDYATVSVLVWLCPCLFLSLCVCVSVCVHDFRSVSYICLLYV